MRLPRRVAGESIISFVPEDICSSDLGVGLTFGLQQKILSLKEIVRLFGDDVARDKRNLSPEAKEVVNQ